MCIRDSRFLDPSGLFQFQFQCLVYLDDVIVIGKTFKDHLENLKEVLTRIHGAQLKLSPKKCSLFQKEVQYLGHLVSAAGVSMDPVSYTHLDVYKRQVYVSAVRNDTTK